MNKIINYISIFLSLFSFISCGNNSNLKITSTPSDATVIIDGQESGKTPFTKKLQYGNYKIVLTKKGYNPVFKEISLRSRKQDEDFVMSKVSLDDMVKIPSGEFIMGSSDEEIMKVVRELGGGELGPDVGWFAAERPQHKVYLDEYYIDKYEITNAQYKKFIDSTGRAAPRHWENNTYPEGRADHPVVYVSWEDADAYCQWAGKRLPTEAEWEKAARGTDARIWPWGNTFDPTKCNVECWEGSDSKPVGSYPEGITPYGAFDMAGNVWEWTDSWYDAYPGSKYRTQEFGKKLRVLRGGSWYHYDSLGPIGARCASRDRAAPQSVSYVAGFRCAIGSNELRNIKN
ncbi:MAG: SUMF1/EgtB/PvdO family nonheme iron enzyme [bacterium]